MIKKISINNFKKLEVVSFSVSQSVVIIGPNNSGKSTIFQALCLWEIGVTNYLIAHQKNDLDKKGVVVINRRDLINSPISDARFLWRNKKVTAHSKDSKTQHIKLEIALEGENNGKNWTCKAEFNFVNAESFTCRIVNGLKEMQYLYKNDMGIHFGFLQPMSGISTLEDKLQQGAIARRLGEGKTAEVLRNICYEVLYPEIHSAENAEKNWQSLCKAIEETFGAKLQKPEFIKITGTIQLEYVENGIKYDISSGGRGFQQTLLLLAYMYASPNTILLLDEPDAHLEAIRQRQTFQLINQLAAENNSQILIASHSEVVLEEAVEASKIIAIIENQTIELNSKSDNRRFINIKKALNEVGWGKYYLAKQKKHVLYLEGTTDREMLLCFANKLTHPVEPLLRLANVDYTDDNVLKTAVRRFTALQEFFPELKGLAIFDRINKNLSDIKDLKIVSLKKRELENYFARPHILLKHAELLSHQYKQHSASSLQDIMQECINECTLPLYLKNLTHEWWNDEKLSTNWLDLIFPEFYKKIGIPIDFRKRDYYELIKLLDKNEVDLEIVECLDLLYSMIK
ncbi:MAG: ATP-binding protein [Chitinophagales bacterium]|nr:ATP-binding protein [Chitinophagales bacterium]